MAFPRQAHRTRHGFNNEIVDSASRPSIRIRKEGHVGVFTVEIGSGGPDDTVERELWIQIDSAQSPAYTSAIQVAHTRDFRQFP